jgi:beta-galactosidase
MTIVSFNHGWEFAREGSTDWIPVTLPHDAMIHETRRADAPAWAHGAYFPGGRYVYRKRWTIPADAQDNEIILRFEGVYRHSRVLLDGIDVGGELGGFTGFAVPLGHLEPDTEHLIEVTVDNTETPNARWYTGSGIYRPVWIETRNAIHLVSDGIAFRTIAVASPAQAAVDVTVENPTSQQLEIAASLLLADRTVIASSTASTHGTAATIPLTVSAPLLWSAETPFLYDLEVVVRSARGIEDRRELRVGVRSIDLSAQRGLRVNGEPVHLRGANIHHDSGILGAATFAAAERRRIAILKENGFNAIRSAHNPAAPTLLDACDELGMYVMDELFDGWYDHKTERDDAPLFDEVWPGGIASLVEKDRNHASVLMYSIGNENGEAFSPRGRRVAQQLTDELHRLDPTRAVTIGVNMVGATFAGLAGSTEKEEADTAAKGAPDMTSTALNAISNRFGTLMKIVPRLKAADRGSRQILEIVDVAGYNYGTTRYAVDARLHPNRVMVGTESMPGDIARNWGLVEQLPSLIGDFMWSGWDYLGEAGGGTWAYGVRSAPYLKAYPQLLSGTGALDITGNPGAPAFLAQAVWGLLHAPAITVRPLDVPDGPVARTSWRSTDAIPSWSWIGHEGRRAELEVYSADDEVELIVNGRSLGRRPAGVHHGFFARFRAVYQPGVVEAVAYRDGRETGRSSLRSAGEVALHIRAEHTCIPADDQAVAYLELTLADSEGTMDSSTTDILTLRVDGPGLLAGFGSGAPATEESFVDSEHETYRGRAQAVIRSTGGPGLIRVTASSRNHGTAIADIVVDGLTNGRSS